jgi:chorismate mutase
MVRVLAVLQHRMALEFAKKVGAQRGDRHELSVRRFERGPQQLQKARGRLRGTIAEQLFRLVDGQQHRGFRLFHHDRQIPSEVQKG